MWQKWLNKLIRIKQAAGIEIIFMPDSSLLINAVIIKEEKGTVVKTAEYLNIKSLEQIMNKIPRNIPIGINVSGKGIIHKPIGADAGNDPIGAVIPGARSTDYYFHLFTAGEKDEIAISRRTLLDEQVSLFDKAGYTIIDAGISIAGISSLAHLIVSEKDNNIETSTFSLKIENGKILSYEAKEFRPRGSKPECAIGSIHLRTDLLPAFSIAVNAMADINRDAIIIQEIITRHREQYKYKRYLHYAFISSLSLILLIVFLNFLFYQHYYNLNIQAEENKSLNTEQLNNLDSFQIKVKKKELFLAGIGWLKQAKISEIADKIAAKVPKEVTLTGITIFPIVTANNDKEPLRFRKDTVELTGYCDVPSVLNSWITDIQQTDIIHSAKLENYWYKQENETGNFLIQLILK